MFSLRKALGIIISIVAAVITQQYWVLGNYWGAFAAATIGGFASGAVSTGTLKGGLYGAFTAALTFGASYVSAGWGTLGRIAAQAVTGGIIETLHGGNFGNGFLSAGLTAAIMPGIAKIRSNVLRTIAGALIGGSISEVTGGKFANGAISGAIMAAMMQRRETRYATAEPGMTVESTPDAAGGDRLRRFYEAMNAADEAGISFGDGTTVVYEDKYKYEDNGTIGVCSRNCASILDNGTSRLILGQYDPKLNVITLYRAAVEIQWISGTQIVGGRGVIWSRQLTKSGIESAIMTLGHEAAHSRGIDVHLPGTAYHPKAELAGQRALDTYRRYRDAGGRF